MEQEKKKFPVAGALGIGCLVLVFVVIIGGIVIGKTLFSKEGGAFLRTFIMNSFQKKTGIQLENNGNNGFTVTDSKNGSEVTVSTDKLPSDFPKDFPIYPNAKQTGSIAGTETKEGKGFWVLMETSDDVTKVTTYMKENLNKNLWTIDNEETVGEAVTYSVSKQSLSGTLIVSKGKTDKMTTILITLEPKAKEEIAPSEDINE